MGKRKAYPREVHERAVRMVREHGPEHESQWAAITSRPSAMLHQTVEPAGVLVQLWFKPGAAAAEDHRVVEARRQIAWPDFLDPAPMRSRSVMPRGSRSMSTLARSRSDEVEERDAAGQSIDEHLDAKRSRSRGPNA